MTTAAPSVSRERLLEQEVRNLRTEVERLRLALAEKKGVDVSTLQAPRHGPDPTAKHPAGGSPRVVFLANVVTRPNIEIGSYTYFSGDGCERFESENVLYQTDDPADRLTIGRYASIAPGVRFLMNGANHPASGTTYPFWMFGRGWHERREPRFRGPTTVGNDVWIGLEALILPGVTIGDGAVIGARAVVAHDVPPYAIVAGNPARVVRRRYDDATIAKLLDLRWWDWPPERVTRNLPELLDGRFDQVT